VRITSAGQRPKIETVPKVRSDRLAEGITDPDVLQPGLAVSPMLHVRAKTALQLGESLVESSPEQRIATRDWVCAEAAVGWHAAKLVLTAL